MNSVSQAQLHFRKLDQHDSDGIIALAQKLNPHIPAATLRENFAEMIKMNTYHCFGLFQNEHLVGISSGWLTTRFYSGRQLEIDNVIVDSEQRSQGLGAFFLERLEEWAIAQGCMTLELNTYAGNSRSHKFYFKAGYIILGFHFQKKL